MKNGSVAFIGCGKVSHFHADVLRGLEVDIEGVCGRTRDSKTATAFAEQYRVSRIYTDSQDLLQHSTADYIWVVTPWDVTGDLLDALVRDGRPMLVEKPLATTSGRIERVIEDHGDLNIYCGMNRRHYDFIADLRSCLSSRSVRYVQVTLSEQTRIYDTSDPDEASRVRNLWLNSSTHELDLLLHLFGDLSVERVFRRTDDESGWLTSVNAVLVSSAGFPVFVTANWNSSEAKSVLVETDRRTYRLGPIETLTVSEGLTRIEPTPENPIASYGPNVIRRTETHRDYKPGFWNQAHDFLTVADAGRIGAVSRRDFEDALRVTRLTELLLGTEQV